jgi:hypothetical protein
MANMGEREIQAEADKPLRCPVCAQGEMMPHERKGPANAGWLRCSNIKCSHLEEPKDSRRCRACGNRLQLTNTHPDGLCFTCDPDRQHFGKAEHRRVQCSVPGCVRWMWITHSHHSGKCEACRALARYYRLKREREERA